MRTKITIATLLAGTAQATAILGPLPSTTFPKYSTTVTPSLTSGNVPESFSQSSGGAAIGLYRALRNNLYIFPTQNVVVAGSGTSDVSSIGSQSSTRTFYQTESAQIGTYPSGITAGTASTYASGPTWVACTDVSDALKCNGGAGYNNAATTKSHNIKTRLVMKAGNTAAIQVASDTSAYTWTWNEDLLLASMYQPSGDTVKIDGTQWCSSWLTLMTEGNEYDLVASRGLSGQNKCTFEVKSTDGSKSGPAFYLRRADYANFLFHWVEWAKPTALQTNALLSSNVVGNYQIGDYSSSNTKPSVYLNPLKTRSDTETAWPKSDIAFFFDERNPADNVPGTIGTVTYYPKAASAFGTALTVDVDSQLLMKDIKEHWSQYNHYNGAKADYDRLSKEYKDIGLQNRVLKEEPFNWFPELIPLPEQPCEPVVPPEYLGPSIDFESSLSSTTVVPTQKIALLKIGTTTAPADTYFTRQGFLVSTSDLLERNIDFVGHVFGRLGEGHGNTPSTTDGPFYWGQTSDLAPAMMISIFPNADDDAGLGNPSSTISIRAKSMTWMSNSQFIAPNYVTKPSANLYTYLSAIYLKSAASIVSVALVSASLF